MNAQDMMFAMLDTCGSAQVEEMALDPEFATVILDWRNSGGEARAQARHTQALVSFVEDNAAFVASVIYNAAKGLLKQEEYEGRTRQGAYIGEDVQLATLVDLAYKATVATGQPVGLIAFKASRP